MTVEREGLVNMRDELAHLDEIGSLWEPGADGAEILSDLAGEMEAENGLFARAASASLRRAEEYARTLSSGYDCVVANPPYMGSGKMNPWLSEWVKGHYPEEKGDLCTCFVRRGVDACVPGGYTSLITASSWMFISSFERMRENIAERAAITSLIQQSTHGFPSVTVRRACLRWYRRLRTLRVATFVLKILIGRGCSNPRHWRLLGIQAVDGVTMHASRVSNQFRACHTLITSLQSCAMRLRLRNHYRRLHVPGRAWERGTRTSSCAAGGRSPGTTCA